MKSRINFIIPNPSFYTNVIRSIIDPIRIHLPDSVISEVASEDAVNVHYFREKQYQDLVNIEKGTSVFMSHGIASKNWRDAQYMEPFDYVCVPGPMWKNKLIKDGIPAERLLEVGFPKLDPIFQGKIPRNLDFEPQKTVLYAPTHAIGFPQCSSYPGFINLIGFLPKDFRVISSPHPVHKDSQMPALQELADADAIISDSSSIIFEAWALNKPVIFPDWLVKEGILENWPGTFTADIYRKNIGYHAESFGELIDYVYLAFEQGIDQEVQAFIDEYFPCGLRGFSGNECAVKLHNLKSS